jgi:hypothetical protein
MQATICLFESHIEMHVCTAGRSSDNGRAENKGPCRAVDGGAGLTSIDSRVINPTGYPYSLLAYQYWLGILGVLSWRQESNHSASSIYDQE